VGDGPAVFVFSSDDPAPLAFSSVAHAAGWMEAIDVEDGGYEAIYTVDGNVVDIATEGDRVVLTVTREKQEAALRRRIRPWVNRMQLGADPDDLTAVASEMLAREWEARRPKRPAWLDRWLHGKGPRSGSA
jgi:hypothetical protein